MPWIQGRSRPVGVMGQTPKAEDILRFNEICMLCCMKTCVVHAKVSKWIGSGCKLMGTGSSSDTVKDMKKRIVNKNLNSIVNE